MRPRSKLAFPSLVVFSLLCAACRSDGAAAYGEWAVAVDTLPSGAVRAVNQPPASGIAPTWVVEEEVRIGSIDGDGPDSFGQIKGLAVDEDGRIFVLDAQAQELRVFGPDGRHLRTFGRRGEGPGEFAGANGIMRAPDGRIWVVDPQLARMSVIDPEDGFQTSYRWQVRMWGFVWDGGFDERGRLVERSMGDVAGERWYMLRLYDDRMQPVDSVPLEPLAPPGTDFPGSFRWETTGMSGFISVPFYAQEQRALDPGLALWLVRSGDPSYRIARWVPGGDTTLIVESRRPAVAVTAAERDSAITTVRDVLRQRDADTRQDWSKIPATRPAVTGLFVSDDGDLWARVTTPDPGTTTWDVFRHDGHYRGTAVGELRPYRWVAPVVRGDRFWAVVTDDLDVQYVVAGRLRDLAAGELAAR